MLGEASDIESDCEDGKRSQRIHLKSVPRSELMERLDRYCVERPGVPVNVNYPGARGEAKFLQAYRKQDTPTFCIEAGGQCMRAAVINAVRAKRGKTEARCVRRLGRFVGRRLGAAHSWLEKCKTVFQLEIRSPPPLERVDEWIEEVSRTDAVLIVRIVGVSDDCVRIDHCVVVDCARGEVLDSSEDVSFELRRGVLHGCVGDGVTLQRVEEVWELAVQPKSKNGRKRRRRGPADEEKRRARKGKK